MVLGKGRSDPVAGVRGVRCRAEQDAFSGMTRRITWIPVPLAGTSKVSPYLQGGSRIARPTSPPV
jgi:hypothetical protein